MNLLQQFQHKIVKIDYLSVCKGITSISRMLIFFAVLLMDKVELKNMQPTDMKLSTALMALRAIAYQAEKQLQCLTQIASKQDAVDQADIEYLRHCLDAINPAIAWLDEQNFDRTRAALGQPSQPSDI